jgi:hypothetical protein
MAGMKSPRIVARLLLAGALFISPLSAQKKNIWDRFSPLPYGFNVGDVFPTQALPSALDGTPTSIASFRGKKVIVNVFACW